MKTKLLTQRPPEAHLLFLAAVLLSSMAVPSGIAAPTITFFPTSAYSPNTAAMDQTLGVSGFIVEDFEDTTLISGLSIAYTGNGFNTTRTSLNRVLVFSGGWDGNAIETNDPDNNPPASGSYPSLTTFSYAPGALSIGIGLGGFQSLSAPSVEFPVTDHRLYINGVALAGTLESLGGSLFGASLSWVGKS